MSNLVHVPREEPKVPVEMTPEEAEFFAVSGIRVGTYMTNDDGDFFRLENVYRNEHNGKVRYVVYRRRGDGSFSHYGDSSIGEWETRGSYKYIPLPGTPDEAEAEAMEYFVSGKWKTEQEEQEADPVITGSALAVGGTRAYLIATERELKDRYALVERTKAMIKRKTEAMKYEMSKLLKQVHYIRKVIEVGELYTGVNEEILQIADGEPAAMEENLFFHQQLLYMDEEVADVSFRNGQVGIDYRRIPDFDAWVIQPQNLNIVLPEQKGVVVFKVSRQDRRYSEDRWTNSKIDANNRLTYILIRNGERVYRIYSDLDVGPRLFPANEEWEQIMAEIVAKGWDNDNRRLDTNEFSYKRNAAMLQGLLDRTEVFWPLKQEVNLFNLDTYEGYLFLIRDDEPSLTDGRLLYNDWRKQLNKQLTRGSRVFLAKPDKYGDNPQNRYLVYKQKDKYWWDYPDAGVYTIEEVIERGRDDILGARYGDALRILYNPGDRVYDNSWSAYGNWDDGHERKNRLSWLFHYDEDFVLNYDLITIEDIEYYLRNRRERQNYRKMIPVLQGILERRRGELEWEKHFVRLVAERTGASEELVWAAVEWWKTKVLWKRPIMEDDAKALRMIEKRIKRQMGETDTADAG